MATDVTRRFADRVDHYVKARPTYPPEVLETLASECGLRAGQDVADVGSGTGILTQILLDHGCAVYAVEPNAEMRAAAEARLGGYPGFRSVDGRAEATGLADRSIDLVTAAQAFHWFEPVATRRELGRILRPGGWVCALWNTRRPDSTIFLSDYEDLLLRFGTDYGQVRHRWGVAAQEAIAFFGPGGHRERHFLNLQEVDFEGLKARLLSSSYVPAAGQPGHEPMMAALREIFARHAREGRVVIEYDTEMYFGQL